MRTSLVAATLVLLVSGVPVHASNATIQPGIEIVNNSVSCTLGWIFDDSEGNVYAGAAESCLSNTGSTVYHNNASIGTVEWKSSSLDFGLILIDSGRHGDVNGTMLGFPGVPTGVATTADTGLGDICLFSSQGAGFGASDLTIQRAGLLTSNDGTEHHCQFPIIAGDNGGPVALLDDGLALGQASAFGVSVQCCGVAVPAHVGEVGVSLEAALSDASSAGYSLSLRTA